MLETQSLTCDIALKGFQFPSVLRTSGRQSFLRGGTRPTNQAGESGIETRTRISGVGAARPLRGLRNLRGVNCYLPLETDPLPLTHSQDIRYDIVQIAEIRCVSVSGKT